MIRLFQNMRGSSSVHSWSKDCLLALGAVALCTFVAVLLRPITREMPFIAFLPAVSFALWIGGFRLAIFSSVLTSLAVKYFLLSPGPDFGFNRLGLARGAFFILVIAVTSWLFDQQRNRSKSSLRLQHKLLEAAAESILIMDEHRHVIYWNRGAQQLYGWAEPEILGKVPRALLESFYPEPLEDIERQLKETGRWHGRVSRKSKGGRTVVTESSLALDRETGYILQTDLDVTDHSIAENELKHANRALNALSRVNQALIQSSNSDQLLQRAVEILVQEGSYPLAWIAIPNADAERTITIGPNAGSAREYLSGLKLTWGDQPSARGPCGSALRENRVRVAHDFLSDQYFLPWRALAKQHGLRSMVSIPMAVQGTLFAALNLYATEENAFENQEFSLVSELAGNLAFGLTTLRLREQAEEERESRILLEEQFRQAQKMEAIGRLAGGISHDFNNLLMVIMAQTELLSMQLSGDSLARAENVMKSAARAAELTRQLLAFSRKQIVQPKVLCLNPIIEDIAKMSAHLVGENIEIAAALCDAPWLIHVDRSQMEQILMNLIVNARDAMPNGGKLTLETANANLTTEYLSTHPLMSPGRYVMLAVSDTGVGMDAETQARLFEPFFTTKELGKGTGLGLSVVYGIVKQSNGFIWHYSELGKGTCFRIYLPIAEVQESKEVVHPPLAVAAGAKNATVLLVEDEEALRDVISEFLTSAGNEVIAAASHEEALELLLERRSPIDLLLTDVVLKGRNGKQLAEALKDKGYALNVIYMSGYTPSAIVHHGVLEADTMFLQKPFTRTALLAKVQEALGR